MYLVWAGPVTAIVSAGEVESSRVFAAVMGVVEGERVVEFYAEPGFDEKVGDKKLSCFEEGFLIFIQIFNTLMSF